MVKNVVTICLLLFIQHLSFGQGTITGNITSSEDGLALIGVTVEVLPSGRGTLTDVDGNYDINKQMDDSIRFSYIGYKTITMPIGGKTKIDVVLQPNAEILDEIVVIGYGTIKKSDLTGSVSSIKAEDIVKVPAPNAIQALQGKVAGMQILNTSGDPGADPVVRLRGVTTLNNNNPIAVIDGVISDVSQVAQLNPNDIASVEVLKDASATAIYGSRGAAGVIIVTTKRGKSGKNVVSVSVEQSIENVERKIDVMNGREFATFLNAIDPGTYNNLDALPNTDWQNEIYNSNTPITNANFSVSGGSNTSNFYFGLGYFGQQGILPKSALSRLTGKMNLGFDVTKNIKMGFDLSLALSDKENAPGVVGTALRAWPIDRPFLENGNFADVMGGNPVAAIEYTNSDRGLIAGLGNLYASVNFLKDFTFKTSLQFTHDEGRGRSFVPVYFVGPLQQNERNDLTYSNDNATTLIFENTLSYAKEFGKNSLNVLAGYTAQDSRNEFISGLTENLIREDDLFWYLNSGEDIYERVSNNFSRNTLLSYLGRVNYSFDSKYLLTVSLRRDGSSKFGINNRWGNFPSVAAGWNLDRESFFPKISFLNSLKLRASWGIIGNERIPGEAQFSLISNDYNTVFGENETLQPGASFNGGGNPNLKWEETRQTNIGINAGFLNDRLTVELDYYVKNTDDILVPLEPIGYTGVGAFRSIFYNAANVQNSGFEWNVNYRETKGNWSYGVGVLGTTIKNRVTDIGQGIGADSLLVGGDLGNGQQVARTAVGQPIGYLYGYEAIGVFQNQAQFESTPSLFGQTVGDLIYRDVNGDGRITAADRTFIGSSIPNFVYGFNLSAGYKNFTLSADFQGQTGNKIFNGKQTIRFTTLNYEEKFNQFWTGEGSTNEHPRPTVGGVNYLPNSYFVEDGSFIRLRSLTLNYQIPSKSKWKINSANIYVRATNLFTLTKFTGYSPEIGAGSAIDGVIDRGVYPITRIFSLGLNANF